MTSFVGRVLLMAFGPIVLFRGCVFMINAITYLLLFVVSASYLGVEIPDAFWNPQVFVDPAYLKSLVDPEIQQYMLEQAESGRQLVEGTLQQNK